VRLEIRDTDGDVIPSLSECTCGYSPLSILTFSLIFLSLCVFVLGFLLQKVRLGLPAAAHCSFVISTACHPPRDDLDEDLHLKPVMWGVVKSKFGGNVKHCSFTNEEVTEPVEGVEYS
jgi:hypothetical protein